jgi:pilus assembly protein CpaC
LIRDTFPNEEIHVMVARDSLSLGGRVSSQTVSDRVAVLAAPLAKSVVNNLMVAPPGVDRQIILRVKFAELNRSYAQSFGVNLLSTGGLNTLGRTTTQQFAAPTGSNLRSTIPGRNEGFASDFNITDMLNIFMFRPDLNLGALVKALQTQGILQILAEPNLVTTNGKEASFHVGGEFPVPVLQGGGNAGAVTIMFREFGIRLNFHPIITANKTIKMHVRPEVSTIDLANAVTFNGFTIPALSTRKIETDVELGEGQSFVIGGLLDDRVTDTFNKIPGLSSIPILGALFKSRAETKTKSELVVLVTPEITTPLQPNDPKPMPAFPREFVPNSTPNTAGPVSKAVMPKK